jgi:hypothetical protein
MPFPKLTDAKLPELKVSERREISMQKAGDLNLLIGRYRCDEHAHSYVPRPQNQRRTFYYIQPHHFPKGLLCGACLMLGRISHGGLIISEESRRDGTVLFQAFAGWQLTDGQIQSATQIWPRP